MKWVGGFDGIASAEPLFDSDAIDVVISELRIGKADVLEYWQERLPLREKFKLVLHSYNGNPIHIARAAASGAWDYVLKRESLHRLIAACKSTVEGNRIPSSMVAVASQYLRTVHAYDNSSAAPLTPRESQVLTHLTLGLSNREISLSMAISLETVKEHVQNILRKLKTKDRTAAAIWGIRNGRPTLRVDGVSLLADGATASHMDGSGVH